MRSYLAATLALIVCAQAGAIPQRVSLSSSLGAEELALRLGLAEGASRLEFGLDARAEASYLSACLELRSPAGPGPRLAAGPGSAASSLRFLADPSSGSAVAPGPLVEIDGSLYSRTAALCLGWGGLSLFALGEGEGPLALALRSGEAPRSLQRACGGLSLSFGAFGLEAELLASSSFSENQAPGSGWKPDFSSSPALEPAEGLSPVAQAAFLARRKGPSSSALLAAALSFGRLAGGGFALRLEAKEGSGPLELGLRAGVASPGFRLLYGERADRLFGASADARLELGSSASFALSAGAEAEARGARYAPLWGESASAKLSIPLIIDSARFFEASCSAESSPSGELGSKLACALKRRLSSSAASEYARLSAEASWAGGFEALSIGLETEASSGPSRVSLELDLGLRLFEGELLESAVSAEGGARLSLPFGDGGSLRLEASSPEAGIALAPRAAAGGVAGGGAAQSLVLSLRYKASLRGGASGGAFGGE